jgi:two-component system sensor histidine kinase BaeS
VPDEALEKLFDRLYRLDTARSRDSGGSGLGLAICRSLVESWGGGIRAMHSPLGGLSIEILLPRWREEV